MSNTKLALILAAGNGSRLAARSGELPKPLVQLHGKPLLEHVMRGAHEAGIDRFVIVIGYRGHMIQQVVREPPSSKAFKSPGWRTRTTTRTTACPSLRAEPVIHEPFLLMMADHMFEPATRAGPLTSPARIRKKSFSPWITTLIASSISTTQPRSD